MPLSLAATVIMLRGLEAGAVDLQQHLRNTGGQPHLADVHHLLQKRAGVDRQPIAGHGGAVGTAEHTAPEQVS
jgi:hypothetical protein